MAKRNGFTLIELLIVVVIIGILAAVAIPKFSATREKTYFAAMKADLRNLQSQQEAYYSAPAAPGGDMRYTYADVTNAPGLEFTPSGGVEIDIVQAGASGWRATAKHTALGSDKDSRYCAVFVGATPEPPAVVSDLVTCQGER